MIRNDTLLYAMTGYDTIWYAMMRDDTQWFAMIRNDTLWYAIIRYDGQWYAMIRSHTQWYAKTRYDTLWYRMIHFDTQWYVVIRCDTQWYAILRYDALWCAMIRTDTQQHALTLEPEVKPDSNSTAGVAWDLVPTETERTLQSINSFLAINIFTLYRPARFVTSDSLRLWPPNLVTLPKIYLGTFWHLLPCPTTLTFPW